MAPATVRDNKTQNRFELDVGGAVAFANYRRAPSTVTITHTETPRALRGHGVASELVKGALELIRADGLKVVDITVPERGSAPAFLCFAKSKSASRTVRIENPIGVNSCI